MSPTTDTDELIEAFCVGLAAVRSALLATAATARALLYTVTKTMFPTTKPRNRKWWRSTAPAAVAAVVYLQHKQYLAMYKEHCGTAPSMPVCVPAMLPTVMERPTTQWQIAATNDDGHIDGKDPVPFCTEQPVTATVAAAILLGTQNGIDQSAGRVVIDDAVDRTTATNKQDCSTPSVQLRLFEVTLNSRTIDVSCHRF
jgi:hypothetical protein